MPAFFTTFGFLTVFAVLIIPLFPDFFAAFGEPSSFMPAQDLHILWPDEDEGIAEWFTLEGYEHYIRGFGAGQYHRFE